MSMRRFTRLTNPFSKKVDNLQAAVSLHFAHYNFMRVHIHLNVVLLSRELRNLELVRMKFQY
jgi:hypothetical protein